MTKSDNINSNESGLQALIQGYLRFRSSQGTSLAAESHLDDDTLTAFTEGNLTMREADPLVAHLSDCSFCRHKTAELVRLDLAFADMDAVPAVEAKTEPSRVSNVVGGILDRLFGHSDAAVFAHEEKKTKNLDDESENEDETEE